ncbi:MAG: hypothetical protein PHS37_06295, partial [Candidatus Omnitrophica bacterium]|nr:hypothetical protein [Candidatus Omnitrophota bacterium]
MKNDGWAGQIVCVAGMIDKGLADLFELVLLNDVAEEAVPGVNARFNDILTKYGYHALLLIYQDEKGKQFLSIQIGRIINQGRERVYKINGHAFPVYYVEIVVRGKTKTGIMGMCVHNGEILVFKDTVRAEINEMFSDTQNAVINKTRTGIDSLLYKQWGDAALDQLKDTMVDDLMLCTEIHEVRHKFDAIIGLRHFLADDAELSAYLASTGASVGRNRPYLSLYMALSRIKLCEDFKYAQAHALAALSMIRRLYQEITKEFLTEEQIYANIEKIAETFAGTDEETIRNACKNAYKICFRKGLELDEAAAQDAGYDTVPQALDRFITDLAGTEHEAQRKLIIAIVLCARGKGQGDHAQPEMTVDQARAYLDSYDSPDKSRYGDLTSEILEEYIRLRAEHYEQFIRLRTDVFPAGARRNVYVDAAGEMGDMTRDMVRIMRGIDLRMAPKGTTPPAGARKAIDIDTEIIFEQEQEDRLAGLLKKHPGGMQFPDEKNPYTGNAYVQVHYLAGDAIGTFLAGIHAAGAFNAELSGRMYVFVQVPRAGGAITVEAGKPVATDEGIALQHELLEIKWRGELAGKTLPGDIGIDRAAHILAWAEQIIDPANNWTSASDCAFIMAQLMRLYNNNDRTALEQISTADRDIHRQLIRTYFDGAAQKKVEIFEASVQKSAVRLAVALQVKPLVTEHFKFQEFRSDDSREKGWRTATYKYDGPDTVLLNGQKLEKGKRYLVKAASRYDIAGNWIKIVQRQAEVLAENINRENRNQSVPALIGTVAVRGTSLAEQGFYGEALIFEFIKGNELWNYVYENFVLRWPPDSDRRFVDMIALLLKNYKMTYADNGCVAGDISAENIVICRDATSGNISRIVFTDNDSAAPVASVTEIDTIRKEYVRDEYMSSKRRQRHNHAAMPEDDIYALSLLALEMLPVPLSHRVGIRPTGLPVLPKKSETLQELAGILEKGLGLEAEPCSLDELIRNIDELRSRILPEPAAGAPSAAIQKPIVDASIDVLKSEAFIEAHEPGNMRDLASFLVKNITYVDQVEFENALTETVHDFQASCKGPYVVSILGDAAGAQVKSNAWTLGLAREHELAEPVDKISGGYGSQDGKLLADWLLKNPDVEDVLFIDDASYSARQILGWLDMALYYISQDPQLNARTIRIHIAVPYMTKRAESALLNTEGPAKEKLNLGKDVSIIVHSHKIMETIGEKLERLPKKDRDRLSAALDNAYGVGKDNAGRPMTYFQHKKPDYMSSLYADNVEGLPTIYEGAVLNEKGECVKKIPFIPPIMSPYQPDYKEWVEQNVAGTEWGSRVRQPFVKQPLPGAAPPAGAQEKSRLQPSATGDLGAVMEKLAKAIEHVLQGYPEERGGVVRMAHDIAPEFGNRLQEYFAVYSDKGAENYQNRLRACEDDINLTLLHPRGYHMIVLQDFVYAPATVMIAKTEGVLSISFDVNGVQKDVTVCCVAAEDLDAMAYVQPGSRMILINTFMSRDIIDKIAKFSLYAKSKKAKGEHVNGIGELASALYGDRDYQSAVNVIARGELLEAIIHEIKHKFDLWGGAPHSTLDDKITLELAAYLSTMMFEDDPFHSLLRAFLAIAHDFRTIGFLNNPNFEAAKKIVEMTGRNLGVTQRDGEMLEQWYGRIAGELASLVKAGKRKEYGEAIRSQARDLYSREVGDPNGKDFASYERTMSSAGILDMVLRLSRADFGAPSAAQPLPGAAPAAGARKNIDIDIEVKLSDEDIEALTNILREQPGFLKLPLQTNPYTNEEYVQVQYTSSDAIGTLLAAKGAAGAFNQVLKDNRLYVFVEVPQAGSAIGLDAAKPATTEPEIALQHELLEIKWRKALKGKDKELREKYGETMTIDRAAHILAWAEQIMVNPAWTTVKNCVFIKNQLKDLRVRPETLKAIIAAREERAELHHQLIQEFLPLETDGFDKISGFERSVREYAANLLTIERLKQGLVADFPGAAGNDNVRRLFDSLVNADVNIPAEKYTMDRMKELLPYLLRANNIFKYYTGEAENPVDACARIFDNPDNAKDFLKFATLLRTIYPPDVARNDPRPPLRYSLDEGAYFQIAPNLYIAPITESFRRHMLFSLNDDGTVRFACEVKIPGEFYDRRVIAADDIFAVAADIHNANPEFCVKPLYKNTAIPQGEYVLYGDRVSYAEPVAVMVYEYKDDGKRLQYLTSAGIDAIARRIAAGKGGSVSVEQVIEEIGKSMIRQIAEITATVHRLGYQGHRDGEEGGFDYHTGNLRYIEEPDGIRITLVGDLAQFTRPVPLTEESREKDIEHVVEFSGDTRMPPLKDILNMKVGEVRSRFDEAYMNVYTVTGARTGIGIDSEVTAWNARYAECLNWAYQNFSTMATAKGVNGAVKEVICEIAAALVAFNGMQTVVDDGMNRKLKDFGVSDTRDILGLSEAALGKAVMGYLNENEVRVGDSFELIRNAVLELLKKWKIRESPVEPSAAINRTEIEPMFQGPFFDGSAFKGFTDDLNEPYLYRGEGDILGVVDAIVSQAGYLSARDMHGIRLSKTRSLSKQYAEGILLKFDMCELAKRQKGQFHIVFNQGEFQVNGSPIDLAALSTESKQEVMKAARDKIAERLGVTAEAAQQKIEAVLYRPETFNTKNAKEKFERLISLLSADEKKWLENALARKTDDSLASFIEKIQKFARKYTMEDPELLGGLAGIGFNQMQTALVSYTVDKRLVATVRAAAGIHQVDKTMYDPIAIFAMPQCLKGTPQAEQIKAEIGRGLLRKNFGETAKGVRNKIDFFFVAEGKPEAVRESFK